MIKKGGIVEKIEISTTKMYKIASATSFNIGTAKMSIYNNIHNNLTELNIVSWGLGF